MVDTYNNELSSLLDKHAPVTVKKVVLRPHAPWYTEHIRQAKVERRKAERKWCKDKSTINRQILKNVQRHYDELCDGAKTRYYNDKVNAAGNKSKELFQVAKSLLHKQKSTSLPSHITEKDLANKFGQFFSNKISKIRNDLTQSVNNSADMGGTNTSHDITGMSSFTPISESKLEKLIMKGNSKSCALDPIPTSLVKRMLNVLLPIICDIVNKSIMGFTMPNALKEAIVKPLIKKPTLDPENLKNFRPVSNLPYLGKLIENVVINQIDDHLAKHQLHEPLQSAYTPNHSTETAIVKVTNDILRGLDRRQCVYLVLLDLSAAFDTIDHQVFLLRLREDYGVSGGVNDWMESYLTDRFQSIDINGTRSDKIKSEYGFPQGSKIGPFGFKLYTKRLAAIAQKHGVYLHLYADDTQLYLPFDPQNSKSAMEQMIACIAEIKLWMANNYLKLNEDKTEFIIFGTPHDLKSVSHRTVSVGDEEVLPSTTVRNIGAMLDSSLAMTSHINSITKSCYTQLRNISKVRKYLSEDSAKILINALVTSRLDTMNSLLFKIPDCHIHKLKLIQHNAARVVKRVPRSCHITPILKDLHWLPLPYRIEYKILLLVFKCRRGEGPSYLASMLEEYKPSRSLRSEAKSLLKEPTAHKKYGERAFSIAGPKLWNALTPDLKACDSVHSFKKDLKTHFFGKAYPV